MTAPPWERALRIVPTPEDVLAPPPAAQILNPLPEVQVVYGNGHRMRVPIEDGMVISLDCINGNPTMSVRLS